MKPDSYYNALTQRELTFLYARMEQQLALIPDDDEPIEEGSVADTILCNVNAIEEEWIIDPDVRKQLSLITIIEEDEE